MKKLLLLFAFTLVSLGMAAESYTWKYSVADDYTNATWKGISSSGTQSISPTTNTTGAPIQDVDWTLSGTAAGNKNGEGAKGITYGSGTKPADVTFSTGSFAGKKITKVYIKIQSNSKKCRYDVIVNNGDFSETASDVLYQNNSGTAGTVKDATFTPNTISNQFSFEIKSTGTTTNTKGGFVFCAIEITYEEDDTPAGPVDYVPSFETLNLKVGDKVNPQPADAPEMTFMTNNKTVVTDTDNILEAVGEGTTTIDVMWDASDKWNEGSAEFTVNVSKHEYTPEWGDISLSEGDDYQLVLGENHPELNVESDNEEVALIDENGFIIAGIAGTANITVMWGDKKWADGSAEFTVTVIKPRRDVVLTWSAETANATLGSEFSAPTLSADIEDALAEVVLSSSNTEVAAIEDGDVVIKGAGTATITAAIANSTVFNDATASYTLTVVDPNAPQDVTFDFSTENAYGMTTKPMTAGNDDFETSITNITLNNISIDFTGNYRSWNSTSGPELRMNKNSVLTITAPAGYDIEKISFAPGVSGSAWECILPANTTITETKNGNKIIARVWTPGDGCFSSAKFSFTANSRIGSITVSLKACPAEAPELTLEGSKVIATPKSADHTIVWRVRPVEGSQSPVMRAVAATDWTSHNVGEVLEHEIQPNEAYYLDVKAMTSNGHESAVNTLLLQNGEVTGIEDVVTEAGEVEYFNLQGIRVVNPENGIFIRRQGGKTSKVAL